MVRSVNCLISSATSSNSGLLLSITFLTAYIQLTLRNHCCRAHFSHTQLHRRFYTDLRLALTVWLNVLQPIFILL